MKQEPRSTDQEDCRGCQEEWIDGVQRIDGVEPLEEDGGGCDHLLTKLQLLTQGLESGMSRDINIF